MRVRGFVPSISDMNLSRLRRLRLTHRIITLLAAIWLSLALQPCAMAFVPMTPDRVMSQDHCPNCPEYRAKPGADCALSDWQLTKSASSSASLDAPTHALIPFTLLQYALWQPAATATAPPWPDTTLLRPDLPVARQDILRL